MREFLIGFSMISIKKLLVSFIVGFVIFALTGCSIADYEGKSAEEWHTSYVFMESVLKESSDRKQALEKKYEDLKECIAYSDTFRDAQFCVFLSNNS